MSWNPQLGVRTHRRSRVVFRLLVTAGWLAVLAAAFGLGYLLAREEATEGRARVQELVAETAALSQSLAEAREERVWLERAHLMDREAKRQAQASLTELQRERLYLAKRVAYLQGLLRDDERGVIEIKALELREGSGPGRDFRYRLMLKQLAPERGRSVGTLTLAVGLASEDGAGRRILGPGELGGAQERPFDFEYFQVVEGEFLLPEGVEPERLILEVEPAVEALAPSSEAFLWPGGDMESRRPPPCGGPALGNDAANDDGPVAVE